MRWSWLAVLVACGPGAPVRLRHQPVLSAVTTTSARVSFTLQEQASIEVKISGAVATTVATYWPMAYTKLDHDVVHYEASLSGLQGGREYSYQILANRRSIAGPTRFRSAPSDPSAEVHAVLFGDSGTGTDEHHAVTKWLTQLPADLVLHTGDLAYSRGTFAEFEKNVLHEYGTWWAGTPFFPTPGNHDYRTDEALPYLGFLALPENASEPAHRERYYAFSWGPVRFYALDSNTPLDQAAAGEPAMLQWFDADVAQAKERFKIAYFHHSPYSSGPHGDDQRAIEQLVPHFEAAHLDVVFTGHDHIYERTQPLLGGQPSTSGISYIVSGGGGARLYERKSTLPRTAVFAAQHHAVQLSFTQGCKLSLVAASPNGPELDRFVLDKCAR